MQETWIIKDKKFKKYISAEEIQNNIRTMASRINHELNGKNPLFIVILNGAFIFASDLLKKVKIDCEVTFVKLSSYSGTQSTGEVKQILGLEYDVTGRTVVIVEDIVDTGLTLQGFLENLKLHNPAEIIIATCLLKPEAFKMKFPVDYLCFSIPNDFVVGYGLDYDGLGRNSSDIYKIIED